MLRGQCLRLLGVRLTTCCICYSASASTSKSIGYEVEADALGENHIFDRNAEQELPSNADTTKLPAAPFIDKYNEDSATDESVGDAPKGRDVTPSAFLLREQEKETQTKGQEEAESIEKRDGGTSERRGLRGVGVLKLNDANAEPSTAKLNGADSADETTLLQTQSSLKKETRVDQDFSETPPQRLSMQYGQDEKRNNETANVINHQFEERNAALRQAAKVDAALKEQHLKQATVDYHRHKLDRAAANHDAAVQNAAAAVDNADRKRRSNRLLLIIGIPSALLVTCLCIMGMCCGCCAGEVVDHAREETPRSDRAHPRENTPAGNTYPAVAQPAGNPRQQQGMMF